MVIMCLFYEQFLHVQLMYMYDSEVVSQPVFHLTAHYMLNTGSAQLKQLELTTLVLLNCVFVCYFFIHLKPESLITQFTASNEEQNMMVINFKYSIISLTESKQLKRIFIWLETCVKMYILWSQ